jgi:hypothetical protein
MVALRVEDASFGGVMYRNARVDGYPRSYDVLGNQFTFVADDSRSWRFAIDVELRDQPRAEFVASALEGDESTDRWGEIEIIAKLSGTPAHIVLLRFMGRPTDGPVEDDGIQFFQFDTDTHLITLGRCPIRTGVDTRSEAQPGAPGHQRTHPHEEPVGVASSPIVPSPGKLRLNYTLKRCL